MTQELQATVVVSVRSDEVAHEALLKEMHKADDLAETHSALIVTISGAAFAFASTQLHRPRLVTCVAVFGILVCVEWWFKIIRHNEIFSSARSKFVAIENKLEIDAARPKAKWLSRFRILQILSFVFLLGWISLLVAIWGGLIPHGSISAEETFATVVKEMPVLTQTPGSQWT